MAATTKPFSDYDQNQQFRKAYIDTGAMTVDGFAASAVGRKITQTISTTSSANDTLTFNFYENSTDLLMTLVVIYTDSTYSTLLSVERTV